MVLKTQVASLVLNVKLKLPVFKLKHMNLAKHFEEGNTSVATKYWTLKKKLQN